jgi:hypothetical protein
MISSKKTFLTALVITPFFIFLSLYIRLNFWPFYQNFGFYQGDIWYFWEYYGERIRNDFFFPIEYPAGYVIVQKLVFLISRIFFQDSTYETFLISHAFVIIPSCLVIVWSIYRLCKFSGASAKFALALLLLSPSMFIYSTINYDIIPQALVFASLVMVLVKRYFLAFFFLGLGTVIKIYPVFLIPIFILLMFSRKVEFKKILFSISIYLSTFVLLNLPYFLYNQGYWFFPYHYQATGNPGMNEATTISYYLYKATGSRILQNSFLPIIIFISWIVSYIFYRKSKLSEKNFIFLSFFALFSAVFGNHIYSAQYILWFLPFVGLLSFPPLFLWMPFDLVNTARIFFFFKLKDQWYTLYIIWVITVLFYLIFYILSLRKLKGYLK